MIGNDSLYMFENRLITRVKLGQYSSIGQICSGVPLTFNNIDEAKCYCVEINALLRKAAESGGVPATVISEKANSFLSTIDKLTITVDVLQIIYHIAKEYSLLVSIHSDFHYSAPIIKALSIIDSDIKGNLSLSSLAKANNISAGYFSVLFKKEMGITLTNYVNQRRIDYAKELLTSTRLSIKDIADNIGISDTNYFIKLFKKFQGKTPGEYRESV